MKQIWSKKSTFVPVSQENRLSLIVLQQFFPKATELFFFTPAGELVTVTKLITKAGSTLFCLPPSPNIAFIALTKEEANNIELEEVSMNRNRRKEEVVDPVARGLVNDLARHMSCLQEQLDQMKRQQEQQLQLILNQIVNTDKPATELDRKGNSCSENAIERGNSNPWPLVMCDIEKEKKGSLGDIGTYASIVLPSAEGVPGVGNSKSANTSLLATDSQPKAEVPKEHLGTANNIESLGSEETDCALQDIVTIRPKIIKRQGVVTIRPRIVNRQARSMNAVSSSVTQKSDLCEQNITDW